MMLTCKTAGCEMGDEKHTPHPDGLIVLCGCCGVEMTEFVETSEPEIALDEVVVDETVVDEPIVEEVIEDE